MPNTVSAGRVLQEAGAPPNSPRPLPDLGAVALIDAAGAAAVGAVSLSAWYELVRVGDAPAPAIRSHRFTRWRVVDVHAYWERRIAEASADDAAKVVAQAKKASAQAKSKRLEKQATTTVEA